MATVSKKGVITAKSGGTAVITCKPKKGFSSKCTVRVTNATPIQPTIKAHSTGYNSVAVSWTRQPGIGQYRVYRKPQVGNLKLVKAVASNITSLKDTNLETGVKYTYTVIAFRKVNGKTHKSPTSKGIVVQPLPSKTKIKKMKAKGKGVTFNIKAVAGATGYNVMRSVSKTKGFAKAATIKAGQKLTFYDKKLKKGRKYYYKVIVFTTVKGTHYYGKYSKVKSFTRKK